jgi:hypothetical protein
MPKSRHRVKNKRTKPIKWKGDREAFMRVAAHPRPTVEFPRPEWNSRIEFTLIPEYPPGLPKSKIVRTRKGGRSIYNVNYILSVSWVNVFNDKFDFEELVTSPEDFYAARCALLHSGSAESRMSRDGRFRNLVCDGEYVSRQREVADRIRRWLNFVPSKQATRE